VEYSVEQTLSKGRKKSDRFSSGGGGSKVRQINNNSKNPVKTAITKIKSRGDSPHVNLVQWGCNKEEPRHNQISQRHTQKRCMFGVLLQFLVLLSGKIQRVPEPVPNVNPFFSMFCTKSFNVEIRTS
jgi:hypothetical protein